MSIEVLVKVLMDEQSEWEKVRDELRVMLTTMFTFTTKYLILIFQFHYPFLSINHLNLVFSPIN